jgi:hypothetical protein
VKQLNEKAYPSRPGNGKILMDKGTRNGKITEEVNAGKKKRRQDGSRLNAAATYA